MSLICKNENFGQPQFLDFPHRSYELLLIVIIVREFDDVFLVLVHQPGSQHQEIGTDGFRVI